MSDANNDEVKRNFASSIKGGSKATFEHDRRDLTRPTIYLGRKLILGLDSSQNYGPQSARHESEISAECLTLLLHWTSDIEVKATRRYAALPEAKQLHLQGCTF